MILYLDSSALVKCYGDEPGALDTVNLVDAAEMVVTSPLTRVEVASALARAVRRGVLASSGGREAYAAFTRESPALIQVPVSEAVLSRAQTFVWEHGLRGYDAVQLASAVAWQERIGRTVTMATFDSRLAHAAQQAGVDVWPAPATTV